MNEIDYILEVLLSEQSKYLNINIPSDIEGKYNLMRSLINARPPFPLSDEFTKAQDAVLKSLLEAKGIVKIEDIPTCDSDNRLKLWQGDITRLEVDAIVNAANSQMLGCFVPLHGCIDNAIHSAAGIQLRHECNEIMLKQGCTEPTGTAKITKGYNLPAKYVIHTVGPIIGCEEVTEDKKNQLADCYRSCLALADKNRLKSIAFCCISTGEFCFPNQKAATIAVSTVVEYLNSNTDIQTLIFNVFKDSDFSIYTRLLK